jgi:hypothetical protein
MLISAVFLIFAANKTIMMKLAARLESLAKLGNFLKSDYGKDELQAVYRRAEFENGWFRVDQAQHAIEQISQQFLDAAKLEKWIANYPDFQEPSNPKTIGLVLAGNIPAVGFHDILCCFVAGHKAQIKYSEKDKVLIPYLLKQLSILNPETSAYFEKVDRLNAFDAVVATGSDNASRYFEHYFSAYPNIIRKNRNSIAILNGEETDDELRALSEDVFRYFGLGCRSVSKLFVPEHFDFENFMRVMDEFSDIMKHNKYKNNFDYNRSIYLLNNQKHLANYSLTLLESPSLLSRISTLHYETYRDQEDLMQKLKPSLNALQLIVGNIELEGLDILPLGSSQQPSLSDYADNVDTIKFLMQLD